MHNKLHNKHRAIPCRLHGATTSPVYPILDLQTALGLQGTFGDKNSATQYGRFDFGKRTKSGLAGLSINLGYDLYVLRITSWAHSSVL